MAGKNKNRSGFLFLFIILVLLGLLIFAYKDKFKLMYDTNFASTKNFFKKFSFKKDPGKNDTINEGSLITEKIKLFEKKEKNNSKKETLEEIEELKKNIYKLQEQLKEQDRVNQKLKEELNKQTKKDNKTQELFTETTNMQEKNEKISRHEQEDKQDNVNIRKGKIYFSKITENEKLILVSVTREIKYQNTPLTETLNTLLAGPSNFEQSHEIITNIPAKTRLLSIEIKNNTAYINLSKEFEYNHYGRESTIAQIKQIVYTTTEFSNIKKVQFLINGKLQTYLGGEGVVINKPLSRKDFS